MKIKDIFLESFSDAKRIFTQDVDEETVDKYIDTFKNLAKRNIITGQDKDIGKWIKQGWESFKEFVDSNKDVATKSQSKKSKKKDSIVAYEDENTMVIIPLSKDASCYYGKQTKWCTAATGSKNYFEEYFYDKNIVLFYIIKDNGRRYASAYSHQVERFEFFNDQDNSMSKTNFEDATNITAEQLKNWYLQYEDKIKSLQHTEKREDRILDSNDPSRVYGYAKNVIKKPFPRGEDIIATSPKFSFGYARDVLKEPFPKGEDTIAKSPDYSYGYARDVLEGRFEKGEDAIAIDPKFAFKYANEIIKGPFPKGEDIISTSSKYSYSYAKDVLGGKRFEQGEKTIINSPDYLADYVINVIGERIPEYEEYIAKKSDIEPEEIDGESLIIDVYGYGEVKHIFDYIEFLDKNYSDDEVTEFISLVNENIPTFPDYIVQMIKSHGSEEFSELNYSSVEKLLKEIVKNNSFSGQQIYDMFRYLDSGERIFELVDIGIFNDKSKLLLIKKKPEVLEVAQGFSEEFIKDLVDNKAEEFNINFSNYNIKDRNLRNYIS